jgi:hypothetical protein
VSSLSNRSPGVPEDDLPNEVAFTLHRPKLAITSVWASGFCANHLERLGIPFCLPVATLLFGLGSTAAAMVQGVVQLVRHEIGGLPAHLQYLLIDAIPP